MNRILKFILTILIIVSASISCSTESKINEFTHKIKFTASSVELIEWNTKDTIENSYVKEFVDDKGRTIELRFYNFKNELDWTGSGFYGGPIIRFDYEKNKIIETYFTTENDLAYDFKTSEVPYRQIYLLNDQNQIVDIKQIYKIDFALTKESLNKTIEHLEFYKDYTFENIDLKNVVGYKFAYKKLNGINPELKK
jgi:uncharacterized protein YxeA